MELFGNVDTAEDLFKLLQTIPQSQRERLPVEIGDEETNVLRSGDLNVCAFDTTETEGCRETGFRIERLTK